MLCAARSEALTEAMPVMAAMAIAEDVAVAVTPMEMAEG